MNKGASKKESTTKGTSSSQGSFSDISSSQKSTTDVQMGVEAFVKAVVGMLNDDGNVERFFEEMANLQAFKDKYDALLLSLHEKKTISCVPEMRAYLISNRKLCVKFMEHYKEQEADHSSNAYKQLMDAHVIEKLGTLAGDGDNSEMVISGLQILNRTNIQKFIKILVKSDNGGVEAGEILEMLNTEIDHLISESTEAGCSLVKLPMAEVKKIIMFALRDQEVNRMVSNQLCSLTQAGATNKTASRDLKRSREKVQDVDVSEKEKEKVKPTVGERERGEPDKEKEKDKERHRDRDRDRDRSRSKNHEDGTKKKHKVDDVDVLYESSEKASPFD